MKPAPGYRIRLAKEEDASALLACLAAAFEPYRSQYTAAAFADTVLDPNLVQPRLREMTVYLAVAGSDAVGTIACSGHGSEGHLRGMAVLPAWHGSGVAAALLQTTEADLRDRGCRQVTLDTTEPLRRAMRFYERHGYLATGRISDFFGMRLHEYAKDIRR